MSYWGIRPYRLEIPVRLTTAALLHAAYLYFLYNYDWFGVRGQTEPLMLIGATSAAGIVVTARVVWSGDAIERVMAAALLISPACWMWYVVHEVCKLWTG